MPRKLVQKKNLVIVVFLLAIFLYVIIRRAWVSDDAYVTFRVADNFTNGYGLRWNVSERVQAYTHPLWLFVVSFFFYFTNEVYHTVIFISIVASLLAFLCLSICIARSTSNLVLGATMLIFSNSFVDFSTSGLENPLTHLLLALFYSLYFQLNVSFRNLFYLSFIASLIGFNRLDILLLVLPALAYTWYQYGRWRGVLPLLLGQVPLVVWSLFSLFYYGFLFPNTSYAKLGITGIPAAWHFQQGLFYIQSVFRFDLIAPLAILGSLVFMVLANNKKGWFIGFGIFAYLVYILRIGGDFMSGRFFAAPFLCAVIFFLRFDFSKRSFPNIVALTLLFTSLGLFLPNSTILPDRFSPEIFSFHGIVDERDAYVWDTGLFSGKEVINHPWSQKGLRFRDDATSVAVITNSGFTGFYAGPDVHLVDIFALADPLLARLPICRDRVLRVGHYARGVPEGYVETLESSRNQIINPRIAAYYEQLQFVTRGPLWDWKRLLAILNLNTRPTDLHHTNLANDGCESNG